MIYFVLHLFFIISIEKDLYQQAKRRIKFNQPKGIAANMISCKNARIVKSSFNF